MLSSFANPFERMEYIANRIRRDVENDLNRTFNTWDVIDYTLPTGTDCYYRMKIRTDDNGHVKVKTMEKEPNKDWEIHLEEYDRGKPIQGGTTNQTKALGQKEQQSQIAGGTKTTTGTTDLDKPSRDVIGSELASFDESFRSMQEFADSIRKDVESQLNRTFGMWDLIDYTPSIDPNNSYYRMKIKIDDNGHVRVKTVEKEPGKAPEVHVEVYDKGTAIQEEKPGQRGSGLPQSNQTTQIAGTTTGDIKQS
jgi:uncharacterized cupredoxin-like copper-binding protein